MSLVSDHERDGTDVLVVGGGAGGLTTATHAARRGAKVLLVSAGPLGGDCTHTGCVPSKTLLAAAAEGASFDEALSRVHRTVARIAATEDERTLARAGIGVVRGRAHLLGDGAIDVDGHVLRSRHIVLATGATAALPPIPGLEAIGALTNTTVFERRPRPDRLAVVGGGAIGCELAQAFARLGTSVTVLEGADRLLPGEDPAASSMVTAALEADGVRVLTGTRVESASRQDGVACLHLGNGEDVPADEVLVATGRRPLSEGLGLEALGVEVDEGRHIVVDRTCATDVPGLWAVGDVTQWGGFTHVAGNMGFVAAVNITKRHRWQPSRKVERRVVPRVVFTSPEVAQVGMTESEAADVGGRVAEVRLDDVDRALTEGRTGGFVKLIAGPRPVLGTLGGGRILGATIVAPRAGELIGEVGLAMKTHMFTGRLAQTMHAYPTWSMALQQAATQFFFTTHGAGARPASASPTGPLPTVDATRRRSQTPPAPAGTPTA
ncbi:dihydrolipoyl dehydrogenase family protein [Rhabdothermincola salaria]|uniref:dihydrolipoyl dehydrogenase family protein n=1 Tax=Rhabdothermincola salaria TaxID=2903142 RepID=UPI001E3BB9A0|nr:NAD(P)/FAD-dependent oxidoreductase [Rhabdothermincola salaria]MCD9624244.1 NAD(P)/FAD-dependent oxidoreductase [Rhabdothermincola salaria]